MSEPKPKHIPPRITRDDFQAGHMKPSSYSLNDISAAIIDHLSRTKGEFTEKQLEGLTNFKYRGSWNFSRPENYEDLKRFFDIYNDVFFNGVLTGYCTLLFFKKPRQGCENVAAYCGIELPGRETNPRFRIEGPKAYITIGEDDDKWTKEHNRAY